MIALCLISVYSVFNVQYPELLGSSPTQFKVYIFLLETMNRRNGILSEILHYLYTGGSNPR